MATTNTFQGKPKPAGKSGHFYEPQRHALQAKGIKTGNLSDSAVYEQYGIQNLEKKIPAPEKEDVPRTSMGLRDTEAEAIQTKEPPKPSLKDRIKELEQRVVSGYKREQELLKKRRQEQINTQLGREPDEDAEESDEDTEEFTGESKYGKILADLTESWSSEDMVGLTESELEDLAVKYESRTKDAFFHPPNPFLEELKKRMVAKEELKLQKQKIDAELEPTRQQVRKEIDEIKKRATEGDKRDWMEKLVGW